MTVFNVCISIYFAVDDVQCSSYHDI